MTKKRALVTGGSGAIGAVICQRLAADGYTVIVHAHRHAIRLSEWRRRSCERRIGHRDHVRRRRWGCDGGGAS